ncbi:hypothetical protein [Herbiconiux sp. L3-i23]|uniref:hypothetical protein n=1 Tax=Herbiconiux sp. L3-i23 TaxID=2905871 RepID=UPI00206026E5|nr:hypothetical protein [Herbiconiux sp. L3-i23]BDI21765.1 hypothetical protein L3i23_05410 [Herbiconiux sp. L3-i23]
MTGSSEADDDKGAEAGAVPSASAESAVEATDREARIGKVVERTRRARRLTIGIALAAGVLYAWDLVEAVGNLVVLLQYAALVGGSLNSFAWLVLGTAIALPVVVYAGALVLARGRGPLRTAVVLAAGLGVVACLSLIIERLLGG